METTGTLVCFTPVSGNTEPGLVMAEWEREWEKGLGGEGERRERETETNVNNQTLRRRMELKWSGGRQDI